MRVEISADVRLDGPQTGTLGTRAQDMIGAQLEGAVLLQGQGGFRQSAGTLRISSAGMVFSGSPNFFSAPISLGEYHRLALRLDFFAQTLTYLVDGTELGTEPMTIQVGNQVRAILSDQFNDAPLVVNGRTQPVNTPELTYDPANYTASFDNYRIESIPLNPSEVFFQFALASVVYGPFIFDRAVDEWAGVAKYEILRRGYLDSAISTTVSTTGSVATPGLDFRQFLTVNFAPGQKTAVLEVPILNDRGAEADEAINLVLNQISEVGRWRGFSSNRLWILDND
ncbi:MAG TPA: hypothetical protein VIY86_02220, partial [Pirellulaceae bacterium]